MNLAVAGEDWSNGGSGWSRTLRDLTVTGPVATTGLQIEVNERWRFELIADRAQSASTVESWLNSQLTLGSDLYVWENVKRQKSFTDGEPSRIGTYWNAQGAIRKNGTLHGTYYKDAAAPSFVDYNGDSLQDLLLGLTSRTRTTRHPTPFQSSGTQNGCRDPTSAPWPTRVRFCSKPHSLVFTSYRWHGWRAW